MIWDHFKQATCLPVMCGCEFIHFEEWIRQPANFWSSTIYLVLGFLLYKRSKTFHQKWWSFLCFILGISSHLAHASFVQLAMSADFASIITLMVFPLQMHYAQKLPPLKSILLTLITFLLVFAVMFYLEKTAKLAICIGIFTVVLFYHFKYLADQLTTHLFIKSIALMVLGFAFFTLDELKVFCYPHSLFQLHSLWHLLTALALYYYGKWIFQSGKW